MASTKWLRVSVNSESNSDLLPAGSWDLAPGETLRVGRGAENCISVAHSKISRAHATILHDGEKWHYTSFGTNGSFLNGTPVSDVIIWEAANIELAKTGIFLGLDLFIPLENSRGTDSIAITETGSITECLEGVVAGDEEAVRLLWAKCFGQICRMAKQNLGSTPKRVADEEDVAASVFESLFFGAVDGRFPDLSDRNNLWRLVAVMTRRKAADYINGEARQKRGGGNIRGHSIFPAGSSGRAESGFDQFVADLPTPLRVAEVDEQVAELLQRLPDDEARQIALARLEGYSSSEIGERLQISERTIRRRLDSIRALWNQFAELASS